MRRPFSSTLAYLPMPNRKIRRIAYATVGAVTGGCLTPVLAPIVLGWFGLSTTGIVAGTAVAGMHAVIGNVASGSAFAAAHSILAMGGAIPVAVAAVGAGLGAGVGTVAAGTGSYGKDPKERDQTDEDAGQDEAGEDGTAVDANGEGPVDGGFRTWAQLVT
ncbi:hypothetical protein F5888DRAFT_1799486 [Russula emetica]|nr:hypothetical protein F5888DRAFT_1799486 [Russula emetica]